MHTQKNELRRTPILIKIYDEICGQKYTKQKLKVINRHKFIDDSY